MKFRISLFCVFLLFFLLSSNLYAGQALESRSVGNNITSAAEDDYPPYSVVTKDGSAGGFSVELLQAALKAVGREVSFTTGPWSEIKQLLIDRKIQVLPLVGRTPEREEYFDFTFPYLNMHGTIMVREGEKGIHELNDLRGHKVAVLKGDNAEEFLRRSNPEADIITTASFEAALRDLSNGQYDAVVIQKLLAMQLLQKTGIDNLRSVGPPLDGFLQSFCFAVPKGEAALLSLLNEGLSIVFADGTFKNLHAKWFASIKPSGHSRIIIGGDSNYPPYEFLDENGNPAGFNVDLTRAIANQLQLNVDIQLGAWSDIRQQVSNGQIDLVQGMFYTPERDKTVDFSAAHSIVGHAIVRRKGSPVLNNLAELAGKSIVVMEGDIAHDLAIKLGYQQQLTTVKTQEQALRQLAAGEFDCALIARIPALYWIKKNDWNNLQVADSSFHSPEYSYAGLHGKESLLADFSEALATLKNSGEYRKIYSKWLGAYDTDDLSRQIITKYVLIAVAPVLALLIAVFIWNKLLKRQVLQRTSELHKEMAERQQLEVQLRQAEKMQAIGQLAGGIAHDFNNQLSGILGFASLLEGQLEDETQNKYLLKIKQSAQRSANLTQQLLAFSRRGKNIAAPTDMHDIILDVLAILQHTINKKIRLQPWFKSPEKMVLGDPSQLQNALLNIAINASDAISGDGEIKIISEALELDKAFCDKSSYPLTPGPYLKISVTDNGCGMSAEVQSRIFEPFYTTKGVGKGTGMGLAGVYGTITGHQGMIHVSSKEGHGTTFCIYLPLAVNADAEEIKGENAGLIKGKAHVLVVDDEDDVRILITAMLEQLGYLVTPFSNGQAAIEYYRMSWSQVDLVLLDMLMPGLDGSETFGALKKINPQIRSILISGFSQNEQAQALLDAGVLDFLGKPFEMGKFSVAVSRALTEPLSSPGSVRSTSTIS